MNASSTTRLPVTSYRYPHMKKFEGRPVAAAKVRITNAGDGLSQAMEIEPEELKLGQRVWIVLEGVASNVAFQPAKDGDGLIRVQTIKAGVATLVEEELVKEVLEAQRLKIEEANGITHLDFDVDENPYVNDNEGFYDPADDPDNNPDPPNELEPG